MTSRLSLLIDAAWSDLRAAMSELRATPGSTALSIAVLAVAVGFSAASIGLVRSQTRRGLDVPSPDQVAYVYGGALQDRDLRTLNGQLSAISSGIASTRRVGGRSTVNGLEYQRLTGEQVSPEYGAVLGFPLLAGRFPAAEEIEKGESVALVSRRLTQDKSPAQLLGTSLVVNGLSFTIIGIVAPEFRGVADPLRPTDFWTFSGRRSRHQSSEAEILLVRLRDQVNAAQLQAAIDVVEPPGGSRSELAEVHQAKDILFPWNRKAGVSRLGGKPIALLSAAGVVLVLAIANLSGIILARRMNRIAALQLRVALGATPSRVRRQALAESAILAVAGALIGIPVWTWAWNVFASTAPGLIDTVPRFDSSTVIPVLVLLVVVILAITFLQGAGLTAKGQATLLEATGGGRLAQVGLRSRLRALFPQLALSIGLLGVAAAVQSTLALPYEDSSSSTDGAIVVLETVARPIVPVATKPGDSIASPKALYDSIEQSLQREALGYPAALVAQVPNLGPPMLSEFHAQASFAARRESSYSARSNVVSPRYFEVLALKVISGETFLGERQGDDPVAVVSHSVAERLWPGRSAVGESIGSWGPKDSISDIRWRRVIGVVADVRDVATGQTLPTVYIPYAQSALGSLTIVARAVDGASALRQLLDVVARVPGVQITRAQSLSGLLEQQVAPIRQNARLFGIIGAFGLVLSMIGIYGAINAATQNRLRELATRVALGAGPVRIAITLLGDLLVLTGVAAIFATGGVLAAVSALQSSGRLGPVPVAPVVMALPAIAIGGVVLLAAALPLRRALRIDAAALLKS